MQSRSSLTQENDSLSDWGRQRREEILRLAKEHARRRRDRRYGAGGALLVCLAAMLLWYGVAIKKAQPLSPRPMIVSAEPVVIIDRIATDPDISRRLSAGNEPAKWTFID